MSEDKVRVKRHTRKLPSGKTVTVRSYLRSQEGEEAPGIPIGKKVHPLPNIDHPQHWNFALQKHEAKVRGKHYDLRLGRAGKAYSWVINSWPKPGEQVWAIEQPTHAQWYMTAEGTIPSGYGAGEVKVEDKGPIIVYESGKNKINFTKVEGRKTEDLALVRMRDKKWKLINYTLPEKEVTKHQYKPKYKETKPEKLKPEDPGYLWKAKIDGAHGLLRLQGGKRPRAYSYRKPKAGGYIEWTHKIPGLFNRKVPRKIGDTWLRVEVWAQGKDHKPLDVEDVSGMLNAGVLKSRQLQKEKGPLKVALIDAIRYKGRDVSDVSGKEKEWILREVAKEMPIFKLPDTARTPEEKKKLLERIKNKEHPQTEEGIVQLPLEERGFLKSPLTKTRDVYVRGFYPAKKGSKYEGKAVGGILYSDTADGPILGHIGTGFSDEMRKDMYENPKKYVGSVAKARGRRYKSGAGRGLAFLGWHPEKGAIGGYSAKELIPEERQRK